MNKSQIVVIIVILIAASVGIFFLLQYNQTSTPSIVSLKPPSLPSVPPRPLPQSRTLITKRVIDALVPDNVIDHAVPFHPQAPLGNWEDPYQANGCEETSLLMTSWYFNNETISATQAIAEIHRVSNVGKTLFGEFRDISTRDTIILGEQVFPELSFALIENPTIDDIKNALEKDNLVIVPTNGTVANNPYYTPPGPLYHMVVVRGYSDERGTFITNDPGTRRGEAFEYSYQNFMNSIGDYFTGYHEPLPSDREKLAIIVSK